MTDSSFDGIAEVEDWLRHVGFEPHDVQPLAGDVSTRRYFRALGSDGIGPATSHRREPTETPSSIVAVYPDDLRAACARFERSTALLEGRGVRVPQIHVSDPEAGFMLLEDVGRRTLYDLRHDDPGSLDGWLSQAAEVAREIALIRGEDVEDLNPPLDGALLRRELDLTMAVFFAPRELYPDAQSRRRLEALFDELCDALDREGCVVCHRDYMARNLVPITAERRLAVLDHQDLRLGPPGYDLASLCNDSLYPEARTTAPWTRSLDPLGYHRCVVQRTLKIVGTFARFADRGHDRYMALVAPSLRRAVSSLHRLPEGEGLASDAERWWRPALRAEPV